MKPINDKERTVAYFQFLVLSILFIVVWTVAVFFDYRIKAKDYQVLKEENKRLKGTLVTSTELHTQIDSLSKVIIGFKKMTEIEYKDQVEIFNNDLNSVLSIDKQDTSEISRIKIGISKAFKDWSYCIGPSIRETNNLSLLKSKTEEFNQLKEKYDDLKLQFDDYKNKHPF